MDWKEIQETTKALTGIAAQKINTASDLAALHLRLKTMEYRRRTICEEIISKYVEAIALTDREIANLKAAIASMQVKKKPDAAKAPKSE